MTDELPVARVRPRRRWRMSVIWVVPIVAALVAGYLVYSRLEEIGPTITIKFGDANGVKAGQTEVRYRGVTIGEVTAVDLSDDRQSVTVKVRLRRSASSVAREGTLFWIVRPEVNIRSISGLSTVITGPYIEAFPGSGKAKTEFMGLDRVPPTLGRKGLTIILAAAQLTSIRLGSPVYYRGIEVGSVTEIELGRDSTTAQAHAFIDQRYARLVRVGTRFWDVSGLDVRLSLFRGVEVSLESLRSLAAGGIAFATPDASSPPAKEDTIFVLHDKPEKEWLSWAPNISLPPN